MVHQALRRAPRSLAAAACDRAKHGMKTAVPWLCSRAGHASLAWHCRRMSTRTSNAAAATARRYCAAWPLCSSSASSPWRTLASFASTWRWQWQVVQVSVANVRSSGPQDCSPFIMRLHTCQLQRSKRRQSNSDAFSAPWKRARRGGAALEATSVEREFGRSRTDGVPPGGCPGSCCFRQQKLTSTVDSSWATSAALCHSSAEGFSLVWDEGHGGRREAQAGLRAALPSRAAAGCVRPLG